MKEKPGVPATLQFGMPPRQAIAALRRNATDLIRQLLRARGAKTDDSWRSTLQEIEAAFAYNAWDLLVVAALTSFFHHERGTPAAIRSLSTAQARRFRSALEDKNLRRWRDRWMSGANPLFSTMVILENLPLPLDIMYPERAWHRPAEWALNEFAGHCGVILGDARVAQMGDPIDDSEEAFRLAFDYGASLFEGVIGHPIHPKKFRETLRARYTALKRHGDLPPPPDDQDPVTWFVAVRRRILRHAEAESAVRMTYVGEQGLALTEPGPRFARRQVRFPSGPAAPAIELLPVDATELARILAQVLPPPRR